MYGIIENKKDWVRNQFGAAVKYTTRKSAENYVKKYNDQQTNLKVEKIGQSKHSRIPNSIRFVEDYWVED